MLKKIFEFLHTILEWLCILFGGAFGYLASWFDRLEIEPLQKVFYLLSILLLTLGTIRFIIKWLKDVRRGYCKTPVGKDFIEKADKLNKPTRTIELSEEPEKKGEELVKRVIPIVETFIIKGGMTIMKERFKNFVTLVWNNKVTIGAIIGDAVAILVADYFVVLDKLVAIVWFAEHPIAAWIVSAVVAVIVLAVTIYGITNGIGAESLVKIKERLEAKKIERENALTPEQKVAYNKQLKVFENGLAEVEKKLAEASGVHASLDVLIKGGLATIEQSAQDGELIVAIAKDEDLIHSYKSKIAEVKAKLK